jgi:drug/metabolite transporter (DMT)-like permease
LHRASGAFSAFWGQGLLLAHPTMTPGGLQPALTAMFAMGLLGERITLAQWGGIALGFAGLAVAVWPTIQFGAGIGQLASALAGVACMSYASVYQKRFVAAGDPWTRTALMFIGATVPAAGGAALFELGQIIWTPLVVPRVLVPFAEPLTFVALRNGGAALVLIAIALALRAEWPRTHANIAGLLWAGACLQGFALMGVYWAVYRGCPVSVAALIGR